MRKMFILILFTGFLVSAVQAYGVNVGDKAPVFEGESTQGTIRLSDYLGKKVVILAFYFKDFTPG
jgi:thioredoxin-dependent peroxiredoxin